MTKKYILRQINSPRTSDWERERYQETLAIKSVYPKITYRSAYQEAVRIRLAIIKAYELGHDAVDAVYSDSVKDLEERFDRNLNIVLMLNDTE